MRTYLDDGNAVAYFNTAFLFNPQELAEEHKKKEKKARFQKGETYFLQSPECEGFDVLKKEFEVVATVDSLNGIEMDSLIVKQISGEVGMSFTLTKNDCKLLNLEYENGLLIMPMGMNWIPSKKVEKVIEKIKEVERKFTSRNLATYPLDYETKTIKFMTCKVYGFEISGNCIITPNRKLVKLNDFFDTLQITVRKNIQCSNHFFHRGETIPYRIVTPIVTNKEYGIVDNRKSMFLELDFTKGDSQNGVIPNEFERLEFSDLFTISWDEPLTFNRNNATGYINIADNIWRLQEIARMDSDINKSIKRCNELLKIYTT